MPVGKDSVGFPTHVRVAGEFGQPELHIDSVHGWVIRQACQEARGEDKLVKVRLSEGVVIEVPVAPTVLSAIFGCTTFVLLGATAYLWRLLRLARARLAGSSEIREAPVPAGPAQEADPEAPTAPPPEIEQQQQQQQQQQPPTAIVRPAIHPPAIRLHILPQRKPVVSLPSILQGLP